MGSAGRGDKGEWRREKQEPRGRAREKARERQKTREREEGEDKTAGGARCLARTNAQTPNTEAQTNTGGRRHKPRGRGESRGFITATFTSQGSCEKKGAAEDCCLITSPFSSLRSPPCGNLSDKNLTLTRETGSRRR